MKKIIIAALAAALAAAAFAAVYVFTGNEKVKTMDLVRPDYTITEEKDVYGTDRAVTVDSRGVQAYTIDNKTVIAVEDLAYCGQTVEENGDEIRVTTYYLEDYVPPAISYEKTDAPIGRTAVDTTAVRINNIPISSYCYNGRHYVDAELLGELSGDYNREAGWSDYNFKTARSDEKALALECFRFPRVNVPALLEEMTPMVDKPEFEIYTESENEFYVGGPYEPPRGVLAGINGDGNGDWLRFEPRFFKNDFAVYSNYFEFDRGQIDIFSANKRAERGKDCMFLTPWNTSDVTLSETNEEYIRKTLDKIKSYNRPVIVRYACEMNVSEIGDSPTAFVKAFRRVADIVHEYGFAVMWSVNDLGALNKPYGLYYPGDEYVDWIGVSVYPGHDFMRTAPTSKTDSILFGCGDYGWHTNNLKYIMKFLRENNINKPVGISEGAVETYLGYDGAPSGEELDEWAEPRLANMYWYVPMLYPEIKMITYFNVRPGGRLTGSYLEGKDNYIEIISEALNSGAYKLNMSEDAEFMFVKASETEYKKGEEIPLYTYAYIPEDYTEYVEYETDGEIRGASEKIPYKFTLDANGLSDGGHSLTVRIHSKKGNVYEAEYTLSVNGEKVRIDKK